MTGIKGSYKWQNYCHKKKLGDGPSLCTLYITSSYLTDFQHKHSNFYGLPKIHKSKIISKAIKEQGYEFISCFQPKDLKLRPLVADHKCPTKDLSSFVDVLHYPLWSQIKSYVKDDFDFLKKRQEKLKKDLKTKDLKQVSFDVKSL